jgi:hypothetical protein
MKKLFSGLAASALAASFVIADVMAVNAAPVYVPKSEQVRTDVQKVDHTRRHWRIQQRRAERRAYREARRNAWRRDRDYYDDDYYHYRRHGFRHYPRRHWRGNSGVVLEFRF